MSETTTKKTGRLAAWGSALVSAMMLLIVCGLLGGALLFADRFIPAKAPAAAVAEPAKVGPTFASRGGMAPAKSASAPEAARADTKPAAEPIRTVAPLPAPVAVPSPAVRVTSQDQPASIAALNSQVSAASPPDAPAQLRTASAEKPARKLLCTTFRTYDPQSQTYRGYDGQVKPCRPE